MNCFKIVLARFTERENNLFLNWLFRVRTMHILNTHRLKTGNRSSSVPLTSLQVQVNLKLSSHQHLQNSHVFNN